MGNLTGVFGIATRLRIGRPGLQFLVRERDSVLNFMVLCLLQIVQTASGVDTASCSVGTGVLS